MFSIDTSSLIAGWSRDYRPSVFRGLWDAMAELVIFEQLVASRSVYGEIEEREDRLVDWIKANEAMFVEDDEAIQARVQTILADWPRDVDFTRYLTGADPFVIALAMERGLAVVTGEHPSNSPDAPKIPDACRQYDVRCITLMDMIEELEWQF